MLCSECKDANSVVLPKSPLDIQSEWMCSSCQGLHSGIEMASRERAIRTQMEQELEMNNVDQLEVIYNMKILRMAHLNI